MPASVPYQMFVSEQTLYVRLHGVWSKQHAERALDDVKPMVAPILHSPWAAYVDLRDWIMPSVEAMSAFAQIYDWCLAHNQTHEATICKFSMQRQIIANASGYNQQTQFYTDSPDAALRWLNQQGFASTLPNFTQRIPG